jgi:translation initiation factor 2 alpha subunit (eIF-2alpha)
MPAGDGCKLLLRAIEKTLEKEIWEFYLTVYIHLKEKKSFGQFYSEFKAKTKSAGSRQDKQLTKEEIIAMAEEIRIRHLTQSKQKIKGKK